MTNQTNHTVNDQQIDNIFSSDDLQLIEKIEKIERSIKDKQLFRSYDNHLKLVEEIDEIDQLIKDNLSFIDDETVIEFGTEFTQLITDLEKIYDIVPKFKKDVEFIISVQKNQ